MQITRESSKTQPMTQSMTQPMTHSILQRFKKARRQIQRLIHQTTDSIDARRRLAMLRRRVIKLAEQLKLFASTSRKVFGQGLAGSALLAALALPIGSLDVQAGTPFALQNIAPSSQATLAVDGSITMTFSTALNISTRTAGNIVIHGSQSGFLSDKGTFSGDQVVTFTPDDDFKPGEMVSLTLTDDLQDNSNNGPDKDYQFKFRVLPSSGSRNIKNCEAVASWSFTGFSGFVSNLIEGDLDNDGDLDMFAYPLGGGLNRWEVLENDGDGNFSTKQTFGFANGKVLLGDIDNDGDLDAILGTYGAGNDRIILFNNGDGTFTDEVLTSDNVYPLTIGDLDNDGDLDLAGGRFLQEFSFFENDGSGNFTHTTQSFGVAQTGRFGEIGVGDVDGDQDLDIIYTKFTAPGGTTILENQGGFSFAQSSFGVVGKSFLQSGDMDNDGDLDIAVFGNIGGTELWLNNGDGSFALELTHPVRTDLFYFSDVDIDGDLDILFPHDNKPEIEVWLNNGDASFDIKQFYKGLGFGAYTSMTFGDFDGDGDVDLVGGIQTHEIAIELFRTVGSELNFSPAPNSYSLEADGDIKINFTDSMDELTLKSNPIPTQANVIVHSSLRGHITTKATVSYVGCAAQLKIEPGLSFMPGEEIMVTVTNAQTTTGTLLEPALVYNLRAAVNNGTGFFEFQQSMADTFAAEFIRTGDLNGDGLPDAVFAGPAGYGMFTNNGNGTYASQTISGIDSKGLALGDIDGDCDLDVIICSDSDTLHVLRNNGDGTFVAGTQVMNTFNFGHLNEIATGDLNGDGALDLLSVSDYGDILALINRGDGTFREEEFSHILGKAVALGDLDGDNDLDFVAIEVSSLYSKIGINDGNGNFAVDSGFGAGTQDEVAIADFDGDGDNDVIFSGTDRLGGKTGRIMLNNGDATFSSQPFDDAVGKSEIAIADIDADNDLDIILTVKGDGSGTPAPIYIYSNDGNAGFSRSTLGQADNEGGGLALADLDGDGDLEIITGKIGGSGNDQIQIWSHGIAPAITSVAPECLYTTSASVELNLAGLSLANVTLATVTPPASGSQLPYGNPIVNLEVISSGATTMLVRIPAGQATESGKYTLTLADPEGSTSVCVTINAVPVISGTSCGCPATTLTYSALPATPTGASDTWTILGGVILSGQGTNSVDVEWNQGAAQSITLTRQFANSCSIATVLNMTPKTLIAQQDVQQVQTAVATTVPVLNNDTGSSATLVSVAAANNGSSGSSLGEVTYTSDAGFSGVDVFNYTIEDINGCQATSYVAMVVGDVCLPSNLNYVERQKNGGSVKGLKTVQNTVISPDGEFLYAAGRNEHSIVLFERNREDGTLSYITRYRNGKNGFSRLRYVNDLQISPDGNNLYATAFGDKSIVVMDRDVNTGELTQIQAERDNKNGFNGMKGASALAISPDGKNVYVAGQGENSIAILTRANDGMVSYLGLVKDGSGGVDGIRSVNGVTVSPDGKHVYAAGTGDDAVAVFARATSDGDLTFVERLKDNSGGVNGLSKATAVKVSADGRFVYVTSNGDDGVAVFARNDSSGRLTFVNDYSDRDAGVAGMDGAADVAITADGINAFVSGENDKALANFARKAGSGELDFLERKKDGQQGVDGLKGAKGVETSSDSRFVYVAGAGENSVAVFRRNLKPLAQNDIVLTSELKGQPELGSYGYYMDDTTTVCVLANDVELDGESLKITGLTAPSRSATSVALNADSTKVYYIVGVASLPTDSTSEIDSFTYTVSDGQGGSSTASVSIHQNTSVDKQVVREQQYIGQSGPDLLRNLAFAPNPTVGSGNIRFELQRGALVTASIRDLNGREVAHLVNEQLSSGEYQLQWDGNGSTGTALRSGQYYVVVKATNVNGSRQLTIPFVIMH